MEIKLNLLPPYREEEIKKNKHFRLIVRLELIMFLFVLISFVFLFGLSYILDLNLEIVSRETEFSQDKKQLDDIKKYDEKFSQTNLELEKISKIKKDQLYWSNLFYKINQLIPQGVSMQDISTKDYSVFLIGKAEKREDLVAFKENLEKDNCFSLVNLPLSGLVSKNNIDFQIDLSINENCLKNK